MVLSNYWKIKAYTEVNFYDSTSYIVNNLGIVNMSGSTTQVFINSGVGSGATFQGYAKSARCIKADLYCVVGTGTTAPTAGDYALESNISSSITGLSMVHTTNSDGGSEVTTFTISGSNNTGSDITINEIGIYKNIAYNSTGDTTPVLLVREVLSEPITVQNGSSFSRTFTWSETSTSTVSASATRGELREVKSENEEKRTEPILEHLEEKKEDLSLDVEKAENESEKGTEMPDITEEDEDEAEK